jgi:hypothetical protein
MTGGTARGLDRARTPCGGSCNSDQILACLHWRDPAGGEPHVGRGIPQRVWGTIRQRRWRVEDLRTPLSQVSGGLGPTHSAAWGRRHTKDVLPCCSWVRVDQA